MRFVFCGLLSGAFGIAAGFVITSAGPNSGSAWVLAILFAFVSIRCAKSAVR